MTEPTQEQIKEFWEWCGFRFYQPVEDGAIDVIYPNGSMCLSPVKLAYPPIDPNNLFRYAMPKLADSSQFLGIIMATPESRQHKLTYRYIIDLLAGEDNAVETTGEYPALALFWAIWEVIKNGKA